MDKLGTHFVKEITAKTEAYQSGVSFIGIVYLNQYCNKTSQLLSASGCIPQKSSVTIFV